jgi:hypothetical protein
MRFLMCVVRRLAHIHTHVSGEPSMIYYGNVNAKKGGKTMIRIMDKSSALVKN